MTCVPTPYPMPQHFAYLGDQPYEPPSRWRRFISTLPSYTWGQDWESSPWVPGSCNCYHLKVLLKNQKRKQRPWPKERGKTWEELGAGARRTVEFGGTLSPFPSLMSTSDCLAGAAIRPPGKQRGDPNPPNWFSRPEGNGRIGAPWLIPTLGILRSGAGFWGTQHAVSFPLTSFSP